MERHMQVWSSVLGRKPLDDLPVEQSILEKINSHK
jgi:hypothetical protein